MQGGNGQQPTNSDSLYEQPQAATSNLPQTENANPSNPAPYGNMAPEEPLVTWEASEYIHHHKDSSWYLGFAGAMLLLVAVIYLLIREVFSVIVMVIMGVAIAIYAGRKPNTVRYALSRSAISIGEKRYPLDEFSSFTVMQEGGVYSITLMPTKRFMPPVSIYFAPENNDQIIGVLSNVLPHEERQPDLIDRLMRNIRF